MTAPDAAALARFQRDEHRPAPALDETHAEDAGIGIRHGNHVRAGIEVGEDSPHEPDGFAHLVESNGDAREHVASALNALLDAEACVRGPRMIDAQVEGLPAGPAGESGEPQPHGEIERDDPGPREAIPQARVLLVDVAQPRHLAGQEGHGLVERIGAARIQIDARAPGHDEIEEISLPECLQGGPQEVLLQPRELRQTECKPGVVADRAQIPEMIGAALELEREGPQQWRPRRQVMGRHTLQRLAIRPRKRDGGIAGNARREPVALEQPKLREPPLDALVGVAETLLQPEHLLPND